MTNSKDELITILVDFAKAISNQGYYSTQNSADGLVEILDEHKEMADKTLALVASQLADVSEGEWKTAWHEGVPPHPYNKEWFIAALTGTDEKVVLKRLPEEFSYDFKTADDTYYAAYRIKKWMQLPDSEYVNFKPAQPKATTAERESILMLTAMGFKHSMENGFHIVEGHGFKYSHIGLLNIATRIKDTFLKAALTDQAPDGMVLVSQNDLQCLLNEHYELAGNGRSKVSLKLSNQIAVRPNKEQE